MAQAEPLRTLSCSVLPFRSRGSSTSIVLLGTRLSPGSVARAAAPASGPLASSWTTRRTAAGPPSVSWASAHPLVQVPLGLAYQGSSGLADLMAVMLFSGVSTAPCQPCPGPQRGSLHSHHVSGDSTCHPNPALQCSGNLLKIFCIFCLPLWEVRACGAQIYGWEEKENARAWCGVLRTSQ